MENLLILLIILLISLTASIISYKIGYVISKSKELKQIEQTLNDDLVLINLMKQRLDELHKLNDCNKCWQIISQIKKGTDER
jgi:hypothetical protein